MKIYIDYRGQIDPGTTTREHIGNASIPGFNDRMLLMRPGLQEVPVDLWHAVRDHKAIGWVQSATINVDAAKLYVGPNEAIAEKPDREAKRDAECKVVGRVELNGRTFARVTIAGVPLTRLVLLEELSLGDGEYTGMLVQRGYLRIFECPDGNLDWSRFGFGLDDLAQRTIVVPLLREMLSYVEGKGDALVAGRLKEHIKECASDWHGKALSDDRLVPMMEVA